MPSRILALGVRPKRPAAVQVRAARRKLPEILTSSVATGKPGFPNERKMRTEST
jgi:hypothetical protein